MLDDFEIPYAEEEGDEKYLERQGLPTGTTSITVEENGNNRDKVIGYSGFGFSFFFDADGKFKKVMIWE